MVSAQDEQTPDEVALERILEAEQTQTVALDLSNLSLTELPPEIGQLGVLRSLNLSNNQLSSLPPEMAQLESLTYLILDDNRFSAVPIVLFNLPKLCHLSLFNNQIQSLPPNVTETALLAQSQCTILSFVDGSFSGAAYFALEGNPVDSLLRERLNNGYISIPSLRNYLRNEAWWYMQKLIVSGLAILGVVTLSVLGIRWRNLRAKQKRKNDA
jgi:Leucine-rich repeat (LRR) protein